jgi:Secretion system C-terminal sorting domain/PKD domain
MNKLITYSMLFFLSTTLSVSGQNNTNYWYFGINAGVYFDSAGIHSTTGNINAAEGTASISDGCGLLFYTDGDTVWNNNHQMMVNGFNIGGRCNTFTRSSSTQAALIVRQPASDSIFYIFTTDCIEDNLVDGLSYSIVNMNMNNGAGEVILKNQQLFPNSEEKLTASKHINGCDIWIISHQYSTNNFYSYLLTNSGLNVIPVVSSSGQIHNAPNPFYFNARGYLKASPNGQKLINVNLEGAYSWADTTLPELFNFDKLNGIVTSDFVFPQDTSYWWSSYSSWTIPFYGASFSPDNSKLYLSSGFYGPNLYQFDLNAGSPASIIASKTFLSHDYPFSFSPYNIPTSLVNAPDGKIYVAERWRGYLGSINSPNSAGLACNYVDSAYNLASGTMNDWGGLPNFFEDYINPKLLAANFSFSQSSSGDTIFFTNNSVSANSYYWNFGDGTTSNLSNPFHVYADTGYYNVSLIARDSLCDIDRFCQTVLVSPYTGINEATDNFQFAIFPNPFSDIITIEISKTENLELELFNVLGESLKKIDISGKQKITLQLGEEFSTGIYFIQLKNKNIMQTKRLVKL